ncbi:hypothetical protein [Agarivorans sp. JK6]|uniref:hypothetical protein n=1 Tax=Agarivorans sp. JK6 TaxID=2997426 RepID=UPI0038738C69
MIDKRASIRNKLKQQWERRFSDGLLADYLQGTPYFPYSMNRDHTKADNFRYKQDRSETCFVQIIPLIET